ncbi:MAG: PAS domain-containing protein [Planctomycetota bacterium]
MKPFRQDKSFDDASPDAELERLRVENTQLASLAEQYDFISKHTNEIIWRMDLKFRYTFISPSVERLRGFTVDEAMSQSLDDILSLKSSQQARRLLADALAADTKKHLPIRIVLDRRHKDGTLHPTEMIVSFDRDADGQLTGIIGVSRILDEPPPAR